MKCIGCNETSGLLIRMNIDRSWQNIEYCRSCAFMLFTGYETLKAGTQINRNKATYIIIKIYTEFKKYEPLKLIL